MVQNQTQKSTNPATAPQGLTVWDLDPAHSQAEFTVRHMMIANVRGRMAIRNGVVEWDPKDASLARVEAEIDAASVETGAADRDNHLRSPDFFDAQGHPTIRFASTRVEPLGDERYRVAGDLTIRGVTKPVVLDVEKEGEGKDPWGKHRAGLTATTTLDRAQWGLTWNVALEAGGILVGDKVKITLNVQAVRRD